MKNKRRRLIAYILASSMFLSGCEMEFDDIKNIVNKVKEDLDKRASNTSSMSETGYGPSETEAIIETIPTTEPTAIETEGTTEPVIAETTAPTEDIATETTIPTEPVVEDTQTQTEPITENEEAINEQTKNDIVVYATTNVNIRSSNTANSLKIGSLKINESAFKILSCDNNWDLVKCNDLIGFVCRDYLEYSNESVSTEYVHTVKNDIVLTTASSLNFRTAPTTNAESIAKFASNTELQVIAEVNNGWLLVVSNGVLGYVHGDYTVSLLDKAREQYPELGLTELDVKKLVYTTADTLNMRNGNSTDYEKVGKLSTYESFRVLGEYDDWYFIMTNEYEFGFVSKKYTTDLNDTFVIVDISEQHLYLYNNDVLYYNTPVTTGKSDTPSDIGLFKIYSKETNRYLIGEDYKSFVNYWMPYNGGEGLHDATWRSVFGSDYYTTNGSHGCINMPLEITDDIFETVSAGTRVLVHK